MKKLLLVIFVAVMLIVCFACTPTDTEIIIGSTTALSGKSFANILWGDGSADADVRTLTGGYATVQLTSAGEYVWDTAVTVKDYSITNNADGTKTFTVEINDNLTYSDGTAITAKDYLVTTLVGASPVASDAGASVQAGKYVGQSAYTAYKGGSTPVPFSGIRLLGDYKFSYTLSADVKDTYYENAHGAFSPAPLKVWLGDDVDVKDDGAGAYLTEAWYAKENGSYTKVDQLLSARDDWDKNRPVSGAYKILEWNKEENKLTLGINKKYLGNYEGKKPSIGKITYIKLIDATMFDEFKTGGVDIITGISSSTSITAGLDHCTASEGSASYTTYTRAGYGKLQLVGDYGPTQFKAVRQALASLIDRATYASTYTSGYGTVINGPYCLSSWTYQETKEELESALKAYEFSLSDAVELLENDGWIYNADGTAYSSGVRYKKLTASEASVNGNAEYVCGDGEYATVKIGDDYYMPLALNWATDGSASSVINQLVPMMQESQAVAQAGMVIEREDMDFNSMLYSLYRMGEYSEPAYCIYNLGTGFASPVFDHSGYWMTKYSKSNVIYAGVEPAEGATFTEADKSLYTETEQETIESTWTLYMRRVGIGFHADKTLDELSWNMVYEADTREEYIEYWKDYIIAWNDYLPEIPLYSETYYTFYNSAKIGNLIVTPYHGVANAILYCTVVTAQE